MFDEEDYISDEEESQMFSNNNLGSSKVLVANSGSDFNHLAGEGESLMKMMKERGLDLNDNELKKIKETKTRQSSQPKTKAKVNYILEETGFFDGGDKASVDELIKALNKSFSQADPQQASCILSYLLEKKELGAEERNKFSIMKCNILFGLGAYEDCLGKARIFLGNPYNKLSAAIYSNLMAKCKSQTDNLLSGYMDFLRAKSLWQEHREHVKCQEQSKEEENKSESSTTASQQVESYKESEVDITLREINHTEMEYNIKMSQYKSITNLVYPFYPEFRHRKILQVVCGEYHTLFLVGNSLEENKKSQSQQESTDHLWRTEVFGIGENTVGQITGLSSKCIYSEPVLISQLSGKGIEGIWASRESSLAYDENGNIYEWGIKEQRNELIEITYTVGEPIKKLEKGYQHYSALTKSNKFYSWGKMTLQSTQISSIDKPKLQDAKNIVNFSCGNNHTMAIDSSGDLFAVGSNEMFQLGLRGEKMMKNFAKVNSGVGAIIKVFCLSDCSFLVNEDQEIFFCGKYSHKSKSLINEEEPLERFRQAEFPVEFNDIITISGSIGSYYVTNESGNTYNWEVDTMVKFKQNKENENVQERYVEACRGNIFRVKTVVEPELCTVKRISEELRTYETISYVVTLRDKYGLFGVKDFVMPPRFQILLAGSRFKKDELLEQNRVFLESHKFSTTSDKILLNEIIENKLIEFSIVRDEEEGWKAEMKISVEECGRYYFYVMIEETLVLEEELNIEVSEREKELQDKNKQDRLLKEEEKKRKAEIEKQRLIDERLKREQEEEEKRRETQKRAEEALKKHLREQEEAKNKEEQERKARKELMTGGGFDLTKLKKKSSNDLTSVGTSSTNPMSSTFTEKSEKIERFEKLEKTGESFLPDINQRPSSRKKITLPKPSELMGSLTKDKPTAILKSSVADFSNTGFSIQSNSSSKIGERGNTPKLKDREGKITIPVTNGVTTLRNSVSKTGSGIVKRGLSKKKA